MGVASDCATNRAVTYHVGSRADGVFVWKDGVRHLGEKRMSLVSPHGRMREVSCDAAPSSPPTHSWVVGQVDARVAARLLDAGRVCAVAPLVACRCCRVRL